MMESPVFAKLQKGTKSLDFPSKGEARSEGRKSLEEIRREKTAQAQAYRQKILREAGGEVGEKREDYVRSPGYVREKAADEYARKVKSEAAAAAKDGKASFSQCVFNMANILMGMGMLGLPYVFKSSGWFGGFSIMIFFAFICWRTAKLIGRELNGDPRPCSSFDDSPYKSPILPGSSPAARIRPPIRSFPEIARESFGNLGAFVISAILYFELFSCLAIFFVSLGDHMHALFPNLTVQQHIVILACTLVVPVILLRTARLLSYLSAVGTLATVVVVSSVLFAALTFGDITDYLSLTNSIFTTTTHHVNFTPSGLPVGLGIVAFCFSGHAIVPSIYSSMKNPQHFERVVDFSFATVLLACIVVASSGYYMFGDFVEDQITISLAHTVTNGQLAIQALTWLMVLTAFSKYALTMFPLSLGMEEIVSPYIHNDTTMDVVSAIIKLLLIVLSLCVAIFIPSFSSLCSIVGMTCTMTISVMFPAAAYLKLFGDHISFFNKFGCWVFVIFGAISTVLGTWVTMQQEP